jgi:hypothetical protein
MAKRRRRNNAMAKRRTDNAMDKRRTDNAMTKRRRTDNAMAKRRTDNAMAKRRRTKIQTMVRKPLMILYGEYRALSLYIISERLYFLLGFP